MGRLPLGAYAGFPVARKLIYSSIGTGVKEHGLTCWRGDASLFSCLVSHLITQGESLRCQYAFYNFLIFVLFFSFKQERTGPRL